MKGFRFRRLEQHRVEGTREQMTLSVPIPTSPTGKIYQYSPNQNVTPRLFLVGDAPQQRSIAPEHRTLIRREPGPGTTICPYSGFQAPDSEFTHFDDVRAIKEYLLWAVQQDVHDHFTGLAQDFNRRQPRGGFFSLKLDVKHTPKRKPLIIREDLLRDMRCHICQRAYEVYAISLFCPDCGGSNLALHFQRETDLVAQQILLASQQSSAELAYRLLGNAHEDVLTALETTLRTTYKYLVRRDFPEQAPAMLKGIKNTFQNIQRSTERFATLGSNPFRTLTQNEQTSLYLNIQKRHIIGHNLSTIDETYGDFARDERIGETVRLIGDDIHNFATLCAKIINELQQLLLPAHAVSVSPPAGIS